MLPHNLFLVKYQILAHHFTVTIAIDVYNNSQSFVNIPLVLYRCRKPITLSKKLLLRLFYCNYKYTCSISAHVQTLNKYPDAKNTFGYQSNDCISERSKYSLQRRMDTFNFIQIFVLLHQRAYQS